ncbi:MAG: thioredoxin family protein [archaeon]|nr:thioredoxin family protein [archaeon]
MKIEVLGTGCSKCLYLEKEAREAVARAGITATVEHVFDLQEIIRRGVFSTPALAIDGEIVLSGRVAASDEILSLIKKRS